jgi:signal transduction histidine kinase
MQRLPLHENARWYLLGTVLATTVIFLGVVQYRDNRQLRVLLQQQLRATLQNSLMRMRHGLEMQLSPICNAFDSSTDHPADPGQLASAYARWLNGSAHPALVTDVFMFDASSENLLRMSSDRKKFEASDWSEDLLSLRDQIIRWRDNFGARHDGNPQFLPDNLHDNASFVWYIDESAPALIHPAVASRSHLTFIIVRLNLQELAQHIFPELAQQDLVSEGRLNYQIAVVTGSARRKVIYASDPGFGAGGETNPDVELNMFGPPMAILGASRVSSPSSAPVDHVSDMKLAPGSAFVAGDDRPLRLEPIRSHAAEQGWTLIARHRKGSVEAAVASLYRHNLSIGFGVLVVLAGTLATLLFSVQRAQQLAKARMDFVANVSHELRTPLTGIVSAAQNIADGLIDNKEKTMRYGTAILGQAHQLSELIEQILVFSATEKGKYAYRFSLVDVGEVIAAAVAETSSLARSSGISVEQIADPEIARVRADFRALTQCIQNLVMNAIKYGGDSRWVGVRARMNDAASDHGEVVIAVEDKGSGISKEDLSKIFQPFYRSAEVTRAQIHGSGLGLPIARSIAEAMGGSLTVSSELGKGSTFTVHLPAVTSTKSEQTVVDGASFEAAKERRP